MIYMIYHRLIEKTSGFWTSVLRTRYDPEVKLIVMTISSMSVPCVIIITKQHYLAPGVIILFY